MKALKKEENLHINAKVIRAEVDHSARAESDCVVALGFDKEHVGTQIQVALGYAERERQGKRREG